MKLLKLLPLVIALGLTACGEKKVADAPVSTPVAASSTAAPAATEPAAAVPAAAAPTGVSASAGDLVKGESVYNASCVSCHGAGVMGAPKVGDKAAWAPRIAKGAEALYASAIKGINLMPARGSNPALKDDELKAAVDFMVSK